MPTQNIELSAQVNTTSISQTITALFSTTGTPLSYTQPTSGVSINNLGPATAQYQIDNGPWIVLDKREANYLPVDLSVNRVSVKLINDGSTSTKLDILAQGIADFYIGPSGEQFPVANPPVRVLGYRFVGSLATATPGIGYAFTAGQWYRDGVAIAGQTTLTYTRASADIGAALTFTPTGVAYTANAGATLPIIVVPSNDALPAVPTGVMLSDFTTAARSLPASMTDNTEDPPAGKTSTVTGYLAPGGTINMRPLDIGASPIDLRNGLVSITFKIRPTGTLARTVANVSNCYVNLYNDSNPAAAKTNYLRISFGSITSMGERLTGEWQTLRFPVEIIAAAGIVGTVPDIQAYLQTVRYVGLEFSHNSTNSDPYRVSVDFSNTFPNPLTKGLVVIGFDDCRRDTKAYAYPRMQPFNLPGTLYPGNTLSILDSNDTFYMNTADLLEMQANNWHIAYQAGTTENPGMSVADFAANEIAPLKALYQTKGFLGHEDGSYFSNTAFGSVYQSVFDANFRTMRGFQTYPDTVSFPRPETLPPSNPRELRAFGVDTLNNSFTNGLLPYITRASARKSVAIIVFHATGAGDQKHAADGGVLTTFEKMVEYLNSPAGREAVDTVSWDGAVGKWRLGTP